MPKLLSVSSSTRSKDSWSNKLLQKFEEEFLSSHSDVSICKRFTGDIPHLDFESQRAGRTVLEKHSEVDTVAFALAKELTDELLLASAVVVATPMYNWGPPSSLKAWIDRIINVRTFYQQTGQLADLPLTFIIASGGLYSEGENAKHDFLRPLLVECFTRIGVQDIRFVNCDPAGPMDRGMVSPDSPDSAYTKALSQIPSAAARIRTSH